MKLHSCHSKVQYTLYYDLRPGSRSIFDFDHRLLPTISLDCWPGFAYFCYIFMHYLLAKLWLAMFNLLCSSTNQQLFKMNFCNQSSHYENYGQFPLQMEAITCNQHFSWWTKMNGTQRRSMKNALYVQRYGKRTSRAEVMSNSEKIKPVALAIVEVCKSEGIRQAGS